MVAPLGNSPNIGWAGKPIDSLKVICYPSAPFSRISSLIISKGEAMRTRAGTLSTLVLLFGVVAATCGCATVFTSADTLPPVALPKDKVQVAQATDRLRGGDMLQLRLPDEPSAPLNAVYAVMPDGTIMLPGEGRVQVAGKTLEEARLALRNALTVSYALQTIELTP